MITQLEELVFGLETYEKVKIEDRYLEIYSLLQNSKNLTISNIEEYEILEKCLFKIKELLRVKSSNLNTIIKKKNKLTFEIISSIIQALEFMRKGVLKNAFISISNIDSNTSYPPENLVSISNTLYHDISNNDDLPNKEEKKEEEQQNILKNNSTNSQTNSQLNNQENDEINSITPDTSILTSNKLEFSTKGKVDLRYKNNDLDLSFSKRILNFIYETQRFNATLLYVPSVFDTTYQHHIGLIHPKEIYNPILAPRGEEQIDNDKILSQITNSNFLEKDTSKEENFNKNTSSNIIDNQIKENLHSSKSDYININHSINSIKTRKNEEESLEKLVSSQDSTHTKHNFKEFEGDYKKHSFLNEEIPVEIEFENNQGITLEKKLPSKTTKKSENEEEVIKIYKDEISGNNSKHLQNSYKQLDEKKNKLYNETFEVETFEENEDIMKVFDDEEIKISILENSKNLGILKIDLKKQIPTLNSYAHSFLFSKYFLQAIFDVIQPQATMLISSHKSTQTHLIPRFLEDGIFEFNGNPMRNDELDIIQNQIYETMTNELKSYSDIHTFENKNQNNLHDARKETSNQNIVETTVTSHSSKKKAQYLLSSLRRYA